MDDLSTSIPPFPFPAHIQYCSLNSKLNDHIDFFDAHCVCLSLETAREKREIDPHDAS